MSITQAEIARRLNVSQSAVSQVINRQGSLSKETRRRIQTFLEREDYVSNQMAVSLRCRQSKIIGVILPNLRNPISMEKLRLAHTLAHARGYQVLIGSADDYTESEANLVRQFRSSRVDGLLIISDFFPPRKYVRHFNTMKKEGVAIVSVDPISGLDCPYVSVDRASGMESVMSHLFALGHRRIAFAAYGREQWSGEMRWQGIRHAYEKASLPLPDDDDFYPPYGGMSNLLAAGHEATQLILEANKSRHKRYTAIVALNDHVAIGAMCCLDEHGYEVPRDFSVVGFDGLVESQFSKPKLTTVQQPTREVGEQVFDLLMQLLEGGNKADSRTLETKLVVRDSTGPPRNGE